MLNPTNPLEDHRRSSSTAVVGVALLLTAVIVIFLLAFALPNIQARPHQLPVALVAPGPLATAISNGLERASQGGFEVTVTDSAAAARQLILNREVYGAFIVGLSGLSVQTASAASYAVAGALTAAGEQIALNASLPLTVEDIRPFPAADPRGVGLSAGALPIALGGWIAAAGIIAIVRGNRQRLVAAVLFAVLGGFGLTAVLQYGLGTFDGRYLPTALGATLGIAATAFLVLGLQRLLGGIGIGIAAVLLILLGNPLSGLASAPELLPAPWGAIGQLLPPGATGTLLRNLAFFDGAATGGPILTLGLWAAVGVAMYLLASLRRERTKP